MIGSHPLIAYMRALWAWNHRKTLRTFGLMLITAVTDGIALLSLLPLLGLAGIGQSQTKFPLFNLALTLPQALGIFVGLIALRAGVKAARDITQTDLRNGFVDSLRIDCFAALSQMRWQAIAKWRHSDLTEILLVDVDRVSQCTFYLLKLLSTAGIGLAYAIIALNLSPLGSIMAMGIGLLMLVTQRKIFRQAHAIGRDLGATRRKLAATAGIYLGGIKLAKSCNAERGQIAAFTATVLEIRQHQVNFAHSQARSRGMHEIGGAAVLSLLVWLMLDRMQMPIATVLLMIAIMARLLPMIAETQQNIVQILHALPAFANIQTVLADCAQNSEMLLPEQAPPAFTKSIVFDNVYFRYDDQKPWILNGLTLTLPIHQTTALMGASGAGKSTLADLLVGLLLPNQGRILIDGQSLDPAMLRQWRNNLAYVPQDAFLLHDTIRANLLWGNHNVDDAQLWHVLEQAAAADFVRALPEGLDTIAGERGVRFSGGERQRLALARAFLRRPNLLILDEATSALDAENENLIRQALNNIHGAMTILLIAHRQTTVQDADQILILEGGQVKP